MQRLKKVINYKDILISAYRGNILASKEVFKVYERLDNSFFGFSIFWIALLILFYRQLKIFSVIINKGLILEGLLNWFFRHRSDASLLQIWWFIWKPWRFSKERVWLKKLSLIFNLLPIIFKHLQGENCPFNICS